MNLLLQRNGLKAMESILRRCHSLGARDFLVMRCHPVGRATRDMVPTLDELRELPRLLDSFRDITVGFDVGMGLLLQSEKIGLEFVQPWKEDGAGTRVIAVTYHGSVKQTSFCSFGIPLRTINCFPIIYAQLATLHAESACNCTGLREHAPEP